MCCIFLKLKQVITAKKIGLKLTLFYSKTLQRPPNNQYIAYIAMGHAIKVTDMRC